MVLLFFNAKREASERTSSNEAWSWTSIFFLILLNYTDKVIRSLGTHVCLIGWMFSQQHNFWELSQISQLIVRSIVYIRVGLNFACINTQRKKKVMTLNEVWSICNGLNPTIFYLFLKSFILLVIGTQQVIVLHAC